MRSGDDTSLAEKDPRKELLDDDIDQLSSILQRDKDSISVRLKKCIDYDIESGIDTNKIEYFTSLKKNKISHRVRSVTKLVEFLKSRNK